MWSSSLAHRGTVKVSKNKLEHMYVCIFRKFYNLQANKTGRNWENGFVLLNKIKANKASPDVILSLNCLETNNKLFFARKTKRKIGLLSLNIDGCVQDLP